MLFWSRICFWLWFMIGTLGCVRWRGLHREVRSVWNLNVFVTFSLDGTEKSLWTGVVEWNHIIHLLNWRTRYTRELDSFFHWRRFFTTMGMTKTGIGNFCLLSRFRLSKHVEFSWAWTCNRTCKRRLESTALWTLQGIVPGEGGVCEVGSQVGITRIPPRRVGRNLARRGEVGDKLEQVSEPGLCTLTRCVVLRNQRRVTVGRRVVCQQPVFALRGSELHFWRVNVGHVWGQVLSWTVESVEGGRVVFTVQQSSHTPVWRKLPAVAQLHAFMKGFHSSLWRRFLARGSTPVATFWTFVLRPAFLFSFCHSWSVCRLGLGDTRQATRLKRTLGCFHRRIK